MLTDYIESDITAFKKSVYESSPYKPLFVKIKLVRNCNLRCQMCNHWRSKEASLDIDFFLRIVDELSTMGCKKIHLSGGEPLLYSDFFTLLQHIKKHGIKVTMTTNGTLITQEKAKLLDSSGLDGVNISIDSPCEAIHDKIRGIKGSFNRAVQGFQFLRKQMTDKTMRLNMVVSADNYKTISDFPKFAHELGADSIGLIPLGVHTSDVSFFTKGQIEDYNNNIAKIALNEVKKYKLIIDKDDIFLFGNTENSMNDATLGEYGYNYYSKHRCYAIWTHALIDQQGRVSVCCNMKNQPIIGNLKEKTFKEIWTGNIYKRLREKEQLPISDICKQCALYKKKNRLMEKWINEI
jgi:radical SAM protein with 4Fe4S-binding SPASM domain